MCLAGLVDGHGAILKSTAPSDPGPVIDRALAKVGHCQSERRLLEADLNAGPPPPERYDEREEWLRDVRCRESGTLIEEAIRRQLAAGTSTDALGPYTDALNRTLGVDALVVYDRLMGDPELEGTQWLWYDRQRCIDALAERGALDRLPSTASEVIQLLGGP